MPHSGLSLDLDTGRLYVFLGGLLLFALLEARRPARAWTADRGQRWRFHLGVAVFNTVVVRQLAYVPFLLWSVYVDEEGWGISRWLGLSGWTEILLSIVVLDAFDYWWHRLNHRWPWLWRFHKAHHGDTAMDVSTALRFHPGELLLSTVAKSIWIFVWGPLVVAWFIFEALVSVCAQFHHSNIDFPDRVEHWLSLFIVTPRYHAAHHAVDQNLGNRNFSTILSVWDRLFGTYAEPAPGGASTNAPDALGLPEARELAFSPRAWLTEPFAKRNLGVPAQSATRPTAGS